MPKERIMMKLSPRLSFNGQCEEAIKVYEHCLGGKIQHMQTYGKSPMSERVPPEWQGKIMHATLAVGQSILYAEDALPGQQQSAKGFQLTIGVDTEAEAERVFRALSEGGAVRMPLQKTFWSIRFGVLVDRFGISWEVNCQQSPG
jgi:PhnB protein